MYIYYNHQFTSEDNASISINNRSFRYGDGCFETLKLANGKVLQASLHMERLFASMQTLRFEWPSFFTPEYLVAHTEELAALNQHQALARIRLTIYRGDGGLYDAVQMRPNFLIQSWALNPESNTLNENGLVMDIYTEGHKACDRLANIKSNNFLLYAMAALEAKAAKVNDMVVLNQFGRVADSTIANVWMVKGGEIMTPPLSEGCVHGTMRRYLLEQLPAMGYQVQEFPLTIEALQQADEVFLTNAIFGLKWVRQIGDHNYGTKLAAEIHQTLMMPLWQ